MYHSICLLKMKDFQLAMFLYLSGTEFFFDFLSFAFPPLFVCRWFIAFFPTKHRNIHRSWWPTLGILHRMLMVLSEDSVVQMITIELYHCKWPNRCLTRPDGAVQSGNHMRSPWINEWLPNWSTIKVANSFIQPKTGLAKHPKTFPEPE